MKRPQQQSARVPAFESPQQGCHGPRKATVAEWNLAEAVHRQIRAVTIMLAIGVASFCGCASFSPSGQLPWNNAPPVDASTLAAHQAQLMVRAGESAEQQGTIEEAIRLYEQARRLDPEVAHLDRRLAMLYDQQGDDSRAQTAYEQALAQLPDDPDLLNDIGVYHLRRSRGTEAETWFRRALALRPTHGRATNNLGVSLALQGRMEASFAAFSAVSGSAAAYNNLGVILMRQGNIEHARDHFRRALEHDPALSRAASHLAKIEHSPRT